MKKPSGQLFFLIKSLSKSEKRYFRQYANRHKSKQNHYLELFDAILTQKTYDEALLKEKLQHTSYGNYLAVAKNYLYQQILDSLHLFYQSNSIRSKIAKQLNFCAILARKGLSEQAANALKKARKWVEEYELWEYQPLLIKTERQLMRQNLNQHQSSYQEMERVLADLKTLNWYWEKNNSVLNLHYQRVNVQGGQQQEQLKAIIDDLLEEGPPKQLQAQVSYYRTLATAAFMSGDAKKAYAYNKQTLLLFEEHPTLVELEPRLYLGIFNNFLIDNSTLKQYDEVEKGIVKLRQLPQMSVFKPFAKLESRIFELTYTLQLNARIAQTKFKETLVLIPMVKKGLQKYKKTVSINYQLQFHYLIAYVLFMNQHYEEALEHLDILRKPRYKDIMEELVMAGHRLYLLAHYELGNYLFLENIITTLKRLSKKKKRSVELDNTLFKYIGKLANPVLSRQEKQQLWTLFAEELLPLKQQENTKRAWVYFNFDAWLDAKLGGKLNQ